MLPFPMFSSPNTSPTSPCPRAFRSDRCHPEQREGSAFLLFLRLAPLPSFTPSLGRSLVYTEPRRATNPFIIRTYKKNQGGGGRIPSETVILGCFFSNPKRSDHAPQVPLRHSRQSARITTVAAIAATRETSPPRSVSNVVRADIGFGIRRLPFPVASRSRQDRERTRKKAWVHRSIVGPAYSRVVPVAPANRAGKAGSVRMGRRPFLGPR
jgi:hypothetical protein